MSEGGSPSAATPGLGISALSLSPGSAANVPMQNLSDTNDFKAEYPQPLESHLSPNSKRKRKKRKEAESAIVEIVKHLAGQHDQRTHGKPGEAETEVETAPISFTDKIKKSYKDKVAYYKTPEGKEKLKKAIAVGGCVLASVAAATVIIAVGQNDNKIIAETTKMGDEIFNNPGSIFRKKAHEDRTVGSLTLCADNPADIEAAKGVIAAMPDNYRQWIQNAGTEVHVINRRAAFYGCAAPSQPNKLMINVGATAGTHFLEINKDMGAPILARRKSILGSVWAHEQTHQISRSELSTDTGATRNIKALQDFYSVQSPAQQANLSGYTSVVNSVNLVPGILEKIAIRRHMIAEEGLAFMTNHDFFNHSQASRERVFGKPASDFWANRMKQFGLKVDQAPVSKSAAYGKDEKYPYNVIVDDNGVRAYLASNAD